MFHPNFISICINFLNSTLIFNQRVINKLSKLPTRRYSNLNIRQNYKCVRYIFKNSYTFYK